jgi:excisionase family DNA binding protein
MRNVTEQEHPETRWLTVDELCEMLGLKRSRIYHLTHSGLIPHYKIGQTLRFRLDEIHAWLESKRVRTTE